jgi:T4-like virus Myoviridae tail sheath stabiliser
MNSYFYSGQTRRFLQQFIRILSNFQVSMGNDDAGNATLMTVPIYYGDSSRQVATILRNNSENSLSSVPAMSVYISGWRYDQKRMQEPFFVSKMNLRYRDVDENGQLTSTVGDAVTVERLMPVPYNLTIKVDIWTSNIEQKLQLLEQIAVLFNPSLEIQSTDNYVDWTSLTYVTLTDTNFTSRTVPVGTEDPLDIASLTFELPVWFSAPAKVKNMGVIQKIITSLWDSVGTINQSEGTFDINASTLMARQVYTLFNFNLLYIGNTIKLVNSSAQQGFSAGATVQDQGYSWSLALKNYGQLVNGISQVRLEQDDITIVGTVAYHPTDPEMLLFTPIADTMPANNLDPVNAIIDPVNVTVDSTLLNPVAGTRYLILNDIGSASGEGPALWNRTGFPTLVARTNDIIRYTGTHWTLDFDSSATSSVKYLTNLRTGIQYKWKDQQWTKAVEGRYGAGAWSFVP